MDQKIRDNYVNPFSPNLRGFSKLIYRTTIPILLYGKVNPSVLIGFFLVRISPYGPFPWKWSSAVYFFFSKAGKFKTSLARVPYNKLLTNLASSSRTGEYWPSVVFVRNSLRSVRTATTSGQHSPVLPSRSVSKRLIYQWKAINLCISKIAWTTTIRNCSLGKGWCERRKRNTLFFL